MKIELQYQSLVYSTGQLECKHKFTISGKSLFCHIMGVSSYYEIKEEERENHKSIQLLKGRLEKELIYKLALISKSLSCREIAMQQFIAETKRVYKMLESALFRKFVVEFQLKRKMLLLAQQTKLGKTERDEMQISI